MSISLHLLVLKSHIPKPFPSAVVNHKDGNKHNNKLNNLEWVTCQENIIHAVKTGLTIAPKGELAGNSKINKRQVLKIIELRNKGLYYKEISDNLNISEKIIGDIIRKRTWTHITKDLL